jgi:fumarylacetoacetate (FAA) hydrolase family protein
MTFQLEPTSTLPVDGTDGTLVGRVWRSDVDGPSVIALRADGCYDVSDTFPTVRDVGEARNPAAAIAGSKGERIGDIESILANTPEHSRDPAKPYLLAPVDLQSVKAAGVTFATSLLERVIEEQARGEPQRAAAIRAEVEAAIAGGMWSQYLATVGILRSSVWNNPEPEVVLVVNSSGEIVGATA